MQYTIGTALDRAHEQGSEVEVLLDAHWLHGTVVASDGVGVVLENGDAEHVIARLERISAVRVRASSPFPRTLEPAQATLNVQRQADGAVPMPAPRSSGD